MKNTRKIPGGWITTINGAMFSWWSEDVSAYKSCIAGTPDGSWLTDATFTVIDGDILGSEYHDAHAATR